MNRELKFRAKLVNSDEWLYGGGVIELPNGVCLLLHLDDEGRVTLTTVRAETVGQYIGRKDKNGIDIFEDDIVDFCGQSLPRPHKQGSYQGRAPLTCMTPKGKFALSPDEYPTYRIVEYATAGFSPFVKDYIQSEWTDMPKAEQCEVIGNRHDNPELVEAAA